ncbi:Brain-specific angiogenesis inhibitor 1-associated protein 2 [Lamellibrachia satsuma]|nr:Brain-specific angiogenesis inhibitor 1-associated protein 2 [Lamellibrachia satsuma]
MQASLPPGISCLHCHKSEDHGLQSHLVTQDPLLSLRVHCGCERSTPLFLCVPSDRDFECAMEGCEKIHVLTEAIYKNLIDNFNPGIKQLISTGRIYQKSVLNMTSAAKCYIDCMYGLAQNGQVCKGATSDIGTALLQLAEVCRHINTQVVDSIKLFHSELLMPLETKQETEYRQIQAVYKKYMAGHKYNVVPYEKAQTTLKKHKKKTKAKYGFDQKEMQYTRQVREYRVNLNEYHLQGLRQALLEERQCYCFLLDRTCVVMHNYAERLSKMHQLVTKQISEWRSLSEDASILPESSEAVIQAFRHQDGMYCGVDDIQDLRHSRASECDLDHQTCGQTNSDMSTGRHMMGVGESGSMTCSSTPSTCSDPNQQPDTQLKSVVMPRCQQQASSHVQAMYSYTSADDIQLNFMEGDIIAVLGERKDGWQYGENIHTKSAGWFPISFTQPLSDRRADRHQNSALRHRVKSLGNLYDLGNPNYQFALDTMTGQLQRSHTIAERPMSMYVDGNQLYNMQTSPYGVTKMFIPKTILEAEEKFVASPVSEMDNHYPNNLPPLQRVVPPGGGSRDRVELIPPEEFQDLAAYSRQQVGQCRT